MYATKHASVYSKIVEWLLQAVVFLSFGESKLLVSARMTCIKLQEQ